MYNLVIHDPIKVFMSVCVAQWPVSMSV